MSEHGGHCENRKPKVEIVKHGRMYDRNITFECSCGCVFRTQPEGRVWKGLSWWYAAHCPECWNVAKVEDEIGNDLED